MMAVGVEEWATSLPALALVVVVVEVSMSRLKMLGSVSGQHAQVGPHNAERVEAEAEWEQEMTMVVAVVLVSMLPLAQH